MKKIERGDEDVRPAGGEKQLSISLVKIWRHLAGLYTVLSSLCGASTAYHHHHFRVLSSHFYRSGQQGGETERKK